MTAQKSPAIDPERIRVGLKREIVELFLTQHPGIHARAQELAPMPAERARRRLNAEALRRRPTTHEALRDAARNVAERLGVAAEIEIRGGRTAKLVEAAEGGRHPSAVECAGEIELAYRAPV